MPKLSSRKSRRPKIAVFLNGIGSNYSSTLCGAIASQAGEFGFSVLFFASDVRNLVTEDNKGELKLFTLPDMRGFDGIIIATSTIASAETMEYLRKALPASIPVVSVGPPIGDSFCVKSVNNGSMEALIRHFIEDHGFTRIHYISGTPGNPDAEHRLATYKRVMAEYDLPYDGCIFFGDFNRECAREAIAQFIQDDKELPQAIVCANDNMALGAYAELTRRGFNVPEDIAISGYDGIRDAFRHVPRITTVRQPLLEMGRRAVQIIHDVLTGEHVEREYGYEEQTVLAGSCGCADALPMDEKLFAKELVLKNDDLGIYNNISTSMMELLTGTYTMKDVVEQLASLTRRISFRHLYFCVNEESLVKNTDEYPDEMTLMLGITNGTVHKGLRFKTKDILPAMDENPVVLVFAPLYYKHNTFGYIAYDFDPSSGNMHRIWVKNVSLALENLRTQNALKQYAIAMEENSLHDPMTGVLNRRGLQKRVESLLGTDAQGMLFVIFVDLDGLKRINDTYGHTEGDNAIQVAADILKHCSRPGDIVARIGGDEFVCVGLVPDEKALRRILFSMQSCGKLHNERSAKPYAVNISYGWCLKPVADKLSLMQMIDIADNHLYAQKRARVK
jgi:diguanylate cyclase (GGDEF)-like protein